MSRMELTRRANPLGVVHLTDLRPVAAAARLFSERFSVPTGKSCPSRILASIRLTAVQCSTLRIKVVATGCHGCRNRDDGLNVASVGRPSRGFTLDAGDE